MNGGNSTVGTVDAQGMYTAPQNLPSPATVTVRATSVADGTKSAAAVVTVTSDVSVTVSPAPAAVELGANRQFAATVNGSGNPNRTVTWSVNSITGGNRTVGTVDATGRYTAPQILPVPASVTIAATSAADPAKSGSATASITSTFTLAVAGPAALNNGAMGQFTATLTPAANSNPNPGVTWSLSGANCTGAACGTITSSGLYMAPGLAPSPNSTVLITATSVADTSKAASASSAIQAIIIVSVSPSPVTVALETNQQFMVTVSGTANQGVIWDVNGIVGGDQATVGAISQGGLYFAPVNMPAARQVMIRAMSQADNTKSAIVTAALVSNIALTLQPSGSVRAVNHRETFCAAIANTSNPGVTWSVGGVANGNATVGFIQTPASIPCPPQLGPNVSSVDYLAPGSLPNPSIVNVTVASAADPARNATAPVSIVPNVQVSVTPMNPTLPPGGTQQFTAAVNGTSNQQVTWSLSGPNCLGVTCGAISGTGFFTAPAVASNGPVTVTATSVDDPTQSAAATAAITTGPILQKLLPAGITSVATGGFTLEVDGINFVPSTPGPGSVIRFNGTTRATQCPSTTQCTMTLADADVNMPGDFQVTVENPGPPLAASNAVIFRVGAVTTTEDLISVPDATPVTGKDLAVPEAPTAGTAGTLPLNINTVALINSVTHSCAIGTSFITVQRPATGQIPVNLCVLGDGLSSSNTFTLSGPGDITISNLQNAGTGIVQLTLTVPSTAQAGLRTLFAENQNKERAAATGAVRVK